jgi:hypothetical protein
MWNYGDDSSYGSEARIDAFDDYADADAAVVAMPTHGVTSSIVRKMRYDPNSDRHPLYPGVGFEFYPLTRLLELTFDRNIGQSFLPSNLFIMLHARNDKFEFDLANHFRKPRKVGFMPRYPVEFEQTLELTRKNAQEIFILSDPKYAVEWEELVEIEGLRFGMGSLHPVSDYLSDEFYKGRR